MIEFTPRASADVRHVRLTGCASSEDCDHLAAGHTLSFMQRRLAGTTSTKWVDAIVSHVSAHGRVRLTAITDAAEIVVWHHADLGDIVRVGDPVALNTTYHVFAAGQTWLNVLIEAI